MRIGSIIPQGTDSFKADTWVKIYENELGSPETSITISNLDGNTDVMYRLIVRQVNDYAGSAITYCRPNNDSGANYGNQYLSGNSTTVEAGRLTANTAGMPLTFPQAQNNIGYCELTIHAKSGYLRTALLENAQDISGTTISWIFSRGQVWNNTTDNITSLVIYANQTSGLGVGSILELWKPLAKV